MKTFAEKREELDKLFNRIVKFDVVKKLRTLSYCYGVLSNFVTNDQIDILEKYVSEQEKLEAKITEAEKLETLNDEVRNASSETIAEEL